jgi:hypothetical protein
VTAQENGMRDVALILVAVLFAGPALAQPVRDGRLYVTVVDPSGAIVPSADVTVVGLESSTQAVSLPTTKTGDKGIAILEHVPLGRYSIKAVFPGFDLGLLRDIRVRGGDTRHVIVLPLPRLEDQVAVGRRAQEAAADRRSSEFGLALSQEQIQGLSDDPTELARQLADLAGPDPIIRVDTFEGQQLPPKSQIKSIHVTRDQFAAETAQPGSTFVDVVTQPGIGPLRGTMNFSLRDGSLTGRSQFTPTRGPEQFRTFGGTIGGSLIQGTTSFSASVNGQSNYTSPILHVRLPEGVRAETLGLRQPSDNLNASVLVDHAITRDQVLRIGVTSTRQNRENQGIGDYNLAERAFSQTLNQTTARVQAAGPIGRRSFINTRAAFWWADLDVHSAVEQPSIVVQDSFNSGGAQQKQAADIRHALLASDLDYVRGIHSWRGGVRVDNDWFRASSRFNYLGTYTFTDIDAFNRGAPIQYTRSIGAPEVTYHTLQGAGYVQDDIRVRRDFTLSPGMRYSVQTGVADHTAFEPRFGVTWVPSTNARTTLRASAGIFHSWLPPTVIEQTLRLNGVLQREIIIANPSYPDPGPVSERTLPTSKYEIGEFSLGRNLRYSAGIDQVLSPLVRVNALYQYIDFQQQPRGRNLNAPVNGVRPDPDFLNVIEAVTDTETRRHELFVNAVISFAPASRGPQQPRFNWRRLNVNAGYGVTHARSNSAGSFEVSPSGDPENDWGPAVGDQRYRMQFLVTSTQLRNLTANLTYLIDDGAPYTWLTGFDDNGDGILNDRPAGVGLRSLRMPGQQTINARADYTFVLSSPVTGAQPRSRMTLFVSFNNLTNHQNLIGHSGVQTSTFFRQPRLTANPRTVNIGTTLTF